MILITALSAQLALAPAWAEAQPCSETETGSGCDGYLVKFDSGADAPRAMTDGLDYVVDDVYRTDDRTLLAPLLKSGLVEYIEPNYIATLEDDAALASDSSDWGYAEMRAEYAKTLGLDGTGVRIAIIDSGVNESNYDLKDANFAAGKNYVNNTNDTTDTYFHGTQVAQVIAGADNGVGVTGLAPGATIVPLKCFSTKNDGTIANIVRAINDAVSDTFDCQVINMSLALANDSATLREAIAAASDAGVVLVAAAGNISSGTSSGNDALVYPAAYDNVIAVGAVNSALTVASISRQNSSVDVCAPGAGITFSAYDDTTGTNTKTDSGTSFSAPYITACAALAKQANPSLTSADAEALFRGRAEDLGDAGRDNAYGCGFVRLDNVFSSSWCRLKTASDGTASIEGFFRGDGGGTAAAAVYAATGRFITAGTAAVSHDVGAIHIAIVLPGDYAEVKMFFLSAAYVPVGSVMTL